jgi:thymidylate synthase
MGRIIGNNSKNYTNIIALGFSNQGNVWTRLDPWGSSLVQTQNKETEISQQQFRVLHQNVQYIRNKTEQLTAFIQTTTPNIFAISEHGLKADEVTQCTLEGYTLASYFCRKEHKGGGVAIYSSKTKLQQKPLNWVTEKSIEKN